jgi:hypothetical protein
LLNKPKLFGPTEVYFNSVCYPSISDAYFGLYLGHPQLISKQNPYKGRYNTNLLSADKHGSNTTLISILPHNFLSSKNDFIKG